jgi:hypothetical protein
MEDRVIKNLLIRLKRLERRSTRIRFGRVTDADPLTINLGDAPSVFTDVAVLESAMPLAVGDYVEVLVSGNDLVVQGKVR